MLDWERWTLTHSSAGAVVPVLALLLFPGLALELGLALEIGLALELGLAATWTSSAAAVAEVPGVPELDADGAGEVNPEGGGVAVWGEALLALRVGGSTVGGAALGVAGWLAGGLVEGETDGDGEGEGERRGTGDGDGEGVGVPDDGSAWHTLFVVAGVGPGAACAVPSTPRVRKLPLSKVTAATLRCAKRMGSPVYAARQGYRVLFVIRRRLGDGWARVLISANTLPMHHPSSGSEPGRPGRSRRACLPASAPV
jgi:hypothetical protein